jgi:hypothetical protein
MAKNNTADESGGLRHGSPILLVLQSPREKCWGILDEITAAGVFLRGLDLNAFDDWIRAVNHEEPFIGFGSLFFPMWRVEKITRDEAAGGLPSLCQQAEQRTGRKMEDLMREDEGPLA